MNTFRIPWRRLWAAAALTALSASGWAQLAATTLVTDDAAAHPGPLTDPGLVNGWGISYLPAGPFWVSSNGAGTSTLYAVNPATQATTKVALTVSIPGDGSVTGQVFNGNAAAFHGDSFVFVSEDGTLSGWRGALGTTAEVLVAGSSANVYKGAAIGTVAGNTYLYAANFRTGAIDVQKGSAASPGLAGSFADALLPAGYAPFNIQNLNGSLYVTYARQDATGHDEVAGPGTGIVDKFDLQGRLLGRVATGGTLDAPWGLAIAPDSFGALAGALLVGNFGDGRLNAFDATTHAFLGQVRGTDGTALEIDGLWALTPGNGGSAGSSSLLYFSAGPDDERHGVFGVLAAVPEPSTPLTMLAGLVLGAAALRRRGSTAAGRP